MKSLEEINQKILSGDAVVMTAEEVSRMSLEYTPSEILKKVDIVTTATFAPMCSSGMFINFGHTDPPIRMERITLNNVPVHAGLAAVDAYIGATENSPFNERYGGANIIEELISGKEVKLKAWAKGTDCYPETEVEAVITKNTVNEMILFNPRNAYQNYPCAVNSSGKILYTYMGSLLPDLGNATFSTSGELSPLLNDPYLRTIGIGTRIFLCGTQGYISWYGTQCRTSGERNEFGVPVANSATLAVIGNAREMNSNYIKAAYFEKYGVTIFIGIGIPIPLLDKDMAAAVSVRNDQIHTKVCDYSIPGHPEIGRVNYAQLFSGYINLKNRKIRTASLSSVYTSRLIADELRSWIKNKKFLLTQPLELFPQDKNLNSLQRSL